VTLTRDEIFDAFYADYSAGKAFLHSHSYTGNPIACRAALATLDLLERERPLRTNGLLSELMWNQTAELRTHPHVAEVRLQGMVMAIELAQNVRSKDPYPASERRGLRAYRHALHANKDYGVILRPLGNVLYFMPPYVITPREVEQMCKTAIEAVHAATRDR
jgi:adenosylmethionine-8-amino-7-oxononanoate aminotransferase